MYYNGFKFEYTVPSNFIKCMMYKIQFLDLQKELTTKSLVMTNLISENIIR